MLRLVSMLFVLSIIYPAMSFADEVAESASFKQFLEKAEGGDVDSQFLVAHRLERGIGVAKDPQKAYAWYLKAAEQGHGLAQFIVDTQKPPPKLKSESAPESAKGTEPAPQ